MRVDRAGAGNDATAPVMQARSAETAPFAKGGDRPKADGGFAVRDVSARSKSPLPPFFKGGNATTRAQRSMQMDWPAAPDFAVVRGTAPFCKGGNASAHARCLLPVDASAAPNTPPAPDTAPFAKGGDRPEADGGFAVRDVPAGSKSPLPPFCKGGKANTQAQRSMQMDWPAAPDFAVVRGTAPFFKGGNASAHARCLLPVDASEAPNTSPAPDTTPFAKGGDRPEADGGFAVRDVPAGSKSPLPPFCKGGKTQ